MEKLKMESANLTEQYIDKIAALFPNVITETKDVDGKIKKAINFTLLQQLLQGDLVDGDECYEFTWVGKKQSIIDGNSPIRKTLRPCPEESKDWDTTENLYIEGDNLEVLKLLQGSYLNSIKMMYFDPPYNTGNDFVYRDNFTANKDDYEADLGLLDEDENRLFQNSQSNGRFHSDWCSMMYPRLQLARNLLTEDGLIFISIDDNEVDSLRKICDEVFGESNFIDCIIWKKRYGGGAKEKFLISLHEYVLVFAKNIESLNSFEIPLTEDSVSKYYKLKDKNFEVRGLYRTHPLEATKSMGERKNLVYGIQAPDGSLVTPKRQWLWGEERVKEAIKKDELEFLKAKDGSWSVHTKQYLNDENGERRLGKPFSIIEDVYTQHGTNEIINYFGNAQIFSFPKPTSFLKYLINVGMADRKGIILDCFSGSAATADAIFQQNSIDNGDRKFILIQIPEVTKEESDANKAGYKTICEIGKERIRRAGKQIYDKLEQEVKHKSSILDKMLHAKPSFTAQIFPIEEQKQMHANALKEHGQPVFDEMQDIQSKLKTLDTGFRVLKLDSTNMKDVYFGAGDYTQQMLLDLESNIKNDRTDLDLLYGVLLDWGVSLALPHTNELIGGVKVHFVNGVDLVACFADNVNETVIREIAKRKPLRVVFRDSSFTNSPDKINVTEIFKTISPETTVKVI